MQIASLLVYQWVEVATMWITSEDKKKRRKGMRNASVVFAMAKRGGPMKNPRDKRKTQKERAYQDAAEG